MRTRMVLMLCAALALTVGVATATAGGGNSANAQACQKGGWKNWVTADHTSFKNEGDCVSYAAQGGTLTKTQSQIDCENAGGTFNVGGLSPENAPLAWSCRPTAFDSDFMDTMTLDCSSEGNPSLSWVVALQIYECYLPT